MITGNRLSNLSVGVCEPNRNVLAPSSLTRVNWSPPIGILRSTKSSPKI